MRILFVALDFKPATGGIAEYTFQLAKQAQLFGHEILVVTKSRPDDDAADYPFSVERYPFVRFKKRRFLGYFHRFYVFWSLFKQNKFDLVVANSIKSELFLCSLMSRRHRAFLWLFTYGREINYLPQSKFFRSFGDWITARFLLGRIDKVICISQYSYGRLLKLGFSPSKIALIPPGIEAKDFGQFDHRARKSEDIPVPISDGLEGKKVVLSISRLVERKGFDTVLRALPLVLRKKPDTIYLIAGDGPYRPVLERMVDELGLSDHVRFLGYVPEPMKEVLYQVSDVFVIPNRELIDGDVEGFGIVFLEANLFGLPVVAGNSGGAVDAVLHEKTGLVVDPLDEMAVAGAIIRLLDDKELAKQLGENGKRRAIEEFNWGQSGTRLQHELVSMY